jgi:dTDP-4-dehydrorhamnose reductase
MKKILVTGASGQLGQCLKQQLYNAGDISCYFASKEDLDITDNEAVQGFFSEYNFDYCINTAAYTNVEKAESEQKMAFLVNAEGAYNLAKVCKKHNVVLLHLSTDYVFDGTKKNAISRRGSHKSFKCIRGFKIKRGAIHNHFLQQTLYYTHLMAL